MQIALSETPAPREYATKNCKFLQVFQKNPPTLTYSTLAVSIPLYWTGDIFSSVESWRFFCSYLSSGQFIYSIPLSAFSWGNSSPFHFLFLTLAIPLSLCHSLSLSLSLSVTLSLSLSRDLSFSLYLPLSFSLYLLIPPLSSFSRNYDRISERLFAETVHTFNKSEPVTVGADATVYVRFSGADTYTETKGGHTVCII